MAHREPTPEEQAELTEHCIHSGDPNWPQRLEYSKYFRKHGTAPDGPYIEDALKMLDEMGVP